MRISPVLLAALVTGFAALSACTGAAREGGANAAEQGGQSPGGTRASAEDVTNPPAANNVAADQSTGLLEFRVVDAPNRDVKEIVVTLTHITAHVAGTGWMTLVTKLETVDLLKLVGGSWSSLGITKMPAGKITQVRLWGTDAGPNYVTTPDGVHHPLKVPSGDESGIQVKGGFDLAPCEGGVVTLDFDGKNSIFTHPLGKGAGDEWILRPVIRLKSVVTTTACVDAGPPSTPPPPPASDAGAPPPPPPPPPPPATDGGVTPIDPCAAVTCTGSSYCKNGLCVPLT
ncbi:MAG: hypothetical protein NVS3B20_26820 [Polyangiales bacterium]